LVNLLSLADRIVIGALLLIAGCALPISAAGTFASVGTNIDPRAPSLHLATNGIYRWLRNPMYVGLTLILAGFGILLAGDWVLVMAVLFAVLVHYTVVRREEDYLEAKFGEAYVMYRMTVPRYGWLL